MLSLVAAHAAPSPPFPLYDPLPTVGVSFESTDRAYAGLVSHAASMEKLNINPFLNLSSAPDGGFPVVEEGAQYHAAWLETQGMGGAMWAPRSVRVALDNVLVFLRTQRADGALPARVDSGTPPLPQNSTHLSGDFRSISGLFFAAPAVDVAWYLGLAGAANQSAPYLAELAAALEG